MFLNLNHIITNERIDYLMLNFEISSSRQNKILIIVINNDITKARILSINIYTTRVNIYFQMRKYIDEEKLAYKLILSS
jgi:hypothetical protein